MKTITFCLDFGVDNGRKHIIIFFFPTTAYHV